MQLYHHHLASPTVRKSHEDDFRRDATVLDGHLRQRQFLVGERLTVADFCVASMLMYAERESCR